MSVTPTAEVSNKWVFKRRAWSDGARSKLRKLLTRLKWKVRMCDGVKTRPNAMLIVMTVSLECKVHILDFERKCMERAVARGDFPEKEELLVLFVLISEWEKEVKKTYA